MSERYELLPGVYLRAIQNERFKTGLLRLDFLRPLRQEENALNALLSNLWMAGTEEFPDMRSLTQEMDRLFGADVGPLSEKIGLTQTVGLAATFMEDRYALPGDQVCQPVAALLAQMMLRPHLRDGRFPAEVVEVEKHNLMNLIQADYNDKRRYAYVRMMELLCGDDPYGLSRLGARDQVAAITPQQLTDHWRHVLAHSQLEIFYHGAKPAVEMGDILKKVLRDLPREAIDGRAQRPFQPQPGPQFGEETAVVTQGKLSMGFVSPIVSGDPRGAAMLLLVMVFGGTATSKLFRQLREQQSLCYYISAGYQGAMGLMTVECGVDVGDAQRAREEILRQLALCQAGDITGEELESARTIALSSLQAMADSPVDQSEYYLSRTIAGMTEGPEAQMANLRAVTLPQVMEAARTLSLHTVYYIKGVEA